MDNYENKVFDKIVRMCALIQQKNYTEALTLATEVDFELSNIIIPQLSGLLYRLRKDIEEIEK